MHPGDFGRNSGGVADDSGERAGLAVDQLQDQPVDRRTDRRDVTELAAPELRWNVAYPCNHPEDELANRCRRRSFGGARSDQLAEPILNVLLTIGD